MKLVHNASTASKIMGLVIFMGAFLGIVGYVGYYISNSLVNTVDDMYNNRLLAIKWLNAARAQSRAVEGLNYELFINSNKSKQHKSLQEIKERASEVDKLLSDYSKNQLDTFEKERFANLIDALTTYRTIRKQAEEMALAGKQQEAYFYFENNADMHIDNVNVLLKELADYNAEAAEKEKVQSEERVSFFNKVILAVTVLSILLALGMGWLIMRMITNPLNQIVATIREVARGNLKVEKLNISSQDEFGRLFSEFNTMTQSLKTLVTSFSSTAEQVAASAEELTANADQSAQATSQVAATICDLARGSEKQVTALDTTAAVVEQMSAGIQQIAANANAVNNVAEKTTSAAKDGNTAVDAAIRQMSSIENTVLRSAGVVTKLGDRSKEIGQIVATISGIAGQTNLLALNAAIEAARAGEQGRGFAVVADEVRKLAEQSQEAAKQIAGLITEMQSETGHAVLAMNEGTHEVKVGADVVANAGHAFKEIVRLIDEVSSQIKEISIAIQQMASGSKQIVMSIRDIDNVSRSAAGQAQTVSAATEEHLASMEEVAASSQALAILAEEMQSAVRHFQI